MTNTSRRKAGKQQLEIIFRVCKKVLLKEEILRHYQHSWFFLHFRYFEHSVILTKCLVTCVFELTVGRQHRRDRRDRREGMPPPPTLFCVAKRKKGNKGKKERVSKQKLLKDCHQGQDVTVLAILERLKFKNFSCRPTMVTDNTFQCSMAPPLWQPFYRRCI